MWEKKTDIFGYNFRGLLTSMDNYTEMTSSPECSVGLPEYLKKTWDYAYNPSGEREQKRLVYQFNKNCGGSSYAWEYYLLGGSNEQLAVYQGVEQSDEAIAGFSPDGFGTDAFYDNPRDISNNTVNRVFFYPAEYNVYGVGGAALTWRADSMRSWRKEYKLTDHLGSVRTVLRKGLTDNSYELREQISYELFGDVRERLYCTGSDADPDARLNYIGKQKDGESSLADHGVRKYDSDLGQFTSIDPLWEKQYAWTPYHYCGNNPVITSDPSGKIAPVVPFIIGALPEIIEGAAFLGAAIGLATTSDQVSSPPPPENSNKIDPSVITPVLPVLLGVTVYNQSKNAWKDIRGAVDKVIEHIGYLEGANGGSHGNPKDPRNQNDWKNHIEKHLKNIAKELGKLKKDFESVMKQRGAEEKWKKMIEGLKNFGIDKPFK